MDIRFGKTIVETTIINGEPIRTVKRQKERFKIEEKADALARYSHLYTRWSKGEVSEPGSQVIEKDGKPTFIEIFWVE